ncbi:protein distal antenna-like [Amyelois transitella]|uniref:protein distal antenna-like n=1 Tax=Amyelois transitella TaxID=680683 RepID=UPI0029905F50|nr:protein distal antenna-like [Amyelois transitella]
MATKCKRPRRALTPEDKMKAIQRVNEGESKASVARDISVPESTLRGWCKNQDKLRFKTSQLSSPETDRSNDGEPPRKRARTESPAAAPASPATAGLDLSSSTSSDDVPMDLSMKRSQPSPSSSLPRERRPDPGSRVAMSDFSPLYGLTHLPDLAHSHLGLCFNEIVTNFTLLALLNPFPFPFSRQNKQQNGDMSC